MPIAGSRRGTGPAKAVVLLQGPLLGDSWPIAGSGRVRRLRRPARLLFGGDLGVQHEHDRPPRIAA